MNISALRDEALMIPAEPSDQISHGEVKGEGVRVLRADAALRGVCHRVYRCSHEGVSCKVSR